MSLTGYGKWLATKTLEHQKVSMENLKLCVRLGELQRTKPNAPETIKLQKKALDYYKTWGG